MASCAFFSCHLSLTKNNYNVGNQELLAIKLHSGGVATLAGGGGAPFPHLDRPQKLNLYLDSRLAELPTGSLATIFFSPV